MSAIVIFAAGCLVGGIVGVFGAALMFAARRGDELDAADQLLSGACSSCAYRRHP